MKWGISKIFRDMQVKVRLMPKKSIKNPKSRKPQKTKKTTKPRKTAKTKCDQVYKRKQVLATGSYGQVAVACKPKDKCEYVEKKIDFRDTRKDKKDKDEENENEENPTTFRREVYYNTLLAKSKNLVPKFIAAWTCGSFGYLVFKRESNNLQDAAHARQMKLFRQLDKCSFLEKDYCVVFTEWEIIEMFTLAWRLGQEYGIVHGDMRPDQFLVSGKVGDHKTKKTKLLLGDLGLAGDWAEARKQSLKTITLKDGETLKLEKGDTNPIFGWARSDHELGCDDNVPKPTAAFIKLHGGAKKAWSSL